MAMPSYEVIRANYLAGLWTDRMLKSALVCKAITQEQYETILADKAKTLQTPTPKAKKT